jgi:hypothetical protein
VGRGVAERLARVAGGGQLDPGGVDDDRTDGDVTGVRGVGGQFQGTAEEPLVGGVDEHRQVLRGAAASQGVPGGRVVVGSVTVT